MLQQPANTGHLQLSKERAIRLFGFKRTPQSNPLDVNLTGNVKNFT